MKDGTALFLSGGILLLLLVIGSCRKEKGLATGGRVEFSVDTLHFDTVFTSLGSFTRELKIYNPQSQPIELDAVYLAGGEASFFHLNIDGESGVRREKIWLDSRDSLYVFATVNIDPNQQDNPFLVFDELVVDWQGKAFRLPLTAYGQNAYYIVDSVLPTQTWGTDKPYVIMNNALVDSGATLTILPGARIYVHADSRLYVRGRLLAEGSRSDSIVFQGDRLDRSYFGYEGYPGEWGGLYFMGSSQGSRMKYCYLKNGGNSTGRGLPSMIQLEPDRVVDAIPQLRLENSVLENAIGFGLLSFFGHLEMENCLIYNTGASALAIIQGGRYRIVNSTLVNRGSDKISHLQEPTLAILNYLDQGEGQYLAGDLDARIQNLVVWGSLEEEVYVDRVSAPGLQYQLTMEHCLFRASSLPDYVVREQVWLNEDPAFEDPDQFNFRPQAHSPLVDRGLPLVSEDLDGKIRTPPVDLGCYEY